MADSGMPEGAEGSRPDSPVPDDDEAMLDDAPDTSAAGPRKRKGKSTRWNIPSNALSMLEQVFSKDKFPSVETRKKIAADLKVTPRQVQVWFQNKRQRSTKPPGRPTDTRSILNTSEDIQSALMNFGMTCGFGPTSSVDPTLAQLEVFANEEAGGRMPNSLALLNFGAGMGQGCFSPNSSIDTALPHALDGFSSRDDSALRAAGRNNPHLANACADIHGKPPSRCATEAWMAAAAAQMASLAAANSLANAAAEGKMGDSGLEAKGSSGLSAAAGAGPNWWCSGPGGSMPSVAQGSAPGFGNNPWGMLASNFGGNASASLLSSFPPGAINQLLGGSRPSPGCTASGESSAGGSSTAAGDGAGASMKIEDVVGGLLATVPTKTAEDDADVPPTAAPASAQLGQESDGPAAPPDGRSALIGAGATPRTAANAAALAIMGGIRVQPDSRSVSNLSNFSVASEDGGVALAADTEATADDEHGPADKTSADGPAAQSDASEAAAAALAPLRVDVRACTGEAGGAPATSPDASIEATAGVAAAVAGSQGVLACQAPGRAAMAAGGSSAGSCSTAMHPGAIPQGAMPGGGPFSENAKILLMKHWQQMVAQQQLQQQQLPQGESQAQQRSGAPTPPPPGETAEGEHEPSAPLQQQQQQLQQLQRQQQQLQQQQLNQQQQQLQQLTQLVHRQHQHHQLVAAQHMLQQQQQQTPTQAQAAAQAHVQAAQQHLQQQAQAHLQRAQAHAQAHAQLAQAHAQTPFPSGNVGELPPSLQHAMHEAQRRSSGGPANPAQPADPPEEKKRVRRKSKNNVKSPTTRGGSAAAAASASGLGPMEGMMVPPSWGAGAPDVKAMLGGRPAPGGQPDALMDELIESLFTEELGTIRQHQQSGQMASMPSAAQRVAAGDDAGASEGGASVVRRQLSPSSDDNLCEKDLLQFEVDDSLLLDV